MLVLSRNPIERSCNTSNTGDGEGGGGDETEGAVPLPLGEGANYMENAIEELSHAIEKTYNQQIEDYKIFSEGNSFFAILTSNSCSILDGMAERGAERVRVAPSGRDDIVEEIAKAAERLCKHWPDADEALAGRLVETVRQAAKKVVAEQGNDDQVRSLPEAALTTFSEPGLPPGPPDGLYWAKDRLDGENPVEFIERVYGKAGWLEQGMTKQQLRDRDVALVNQLYRWQKHNELPDSLRGLLLTKKQRNDQIASAYFKRHAGEQKLAGRSLVNTASAIARRLASPHPH